MIPTEEQRKYLTVSQVNEYAKMLMDSDAVLSAIAVRGEISNFKHHYTGHLYFSMKDAGGTLRCVMFASSAQHLKFAPKDGDDVIAYGRISVFPRDGSYQLYVSSMVNAGLGDKYAAFERLKAKLAAEGLFDESRKKPIPRFPQRIGIVTSATGAAIQDLRNILGRRYPPAEILLYPALVQGSGAAASVTAGVRYFDRMRNVDVLIVGRGGGSFEDLDAFNDEGLARAIAACSVPVISAVGHETDFTISDFVADLRAPTPSAAAELAVPDMTELLSALSLCRKRMRNAVESKWQTYKTALDTLASSPVLSSPEKVIDAYTDTLMSFGNRLDAAYRQTVTVNAAKLSALSASLDAMSPLKVLSRGYSLVTSEGKAVTQAANVHPGDAVQIRFAEGTAQAEIKEVNHE